MKLIRYFKFFDYYLKIFAERLSGKSKGNPYHNGEYKVLENVIKRIKFDEPFILIDGGASKGDYSLKVEEISKKYKKKSLILAVECHAPTIKLMKKNLKNINYQLINKSLGESNKKVIFYSDAKNPTSGQNSNINHCYLNSKKKVQQITIDNLLKTKKIKHVNFLKLDIEGFEYKALLGAKQSLKNGCIDYIQIKYNQTWIKAGATIEKILLHSESIILTCLELNINLYCGLKNIVIFWKIMFLAIFSWLERVSNCPCHVKERQYLIFVNEV